MNTHIIAILVNHTDETFYVMEDQAEILDIIMFNDFGDVTDTFGDHIASYISWDNDKEIMLETYRSNAYDYRAEVAQRISDLVACNYTGM